MSRLSAAAPETKNRIRPPKRARILLKTSLSKTAFCAARCGGTRSPASVRRDTSRPTLNAWSKIFFFMPPSSAVMVLMRACAFSKMRGAAPMKVGRDDGQVVDDLLDGAVDRGREADGQLRRQQHLPEGVCERQPQVLHVVEREDVLLLDGVPLVGPRRVTQPHPLGTPGRARGVDQRREAVRRRLLDPVHHGAALVGEEFAAELLEVGERDHPVAVGRALERDDLRDARQVGAAFTQLGRSGCRPRRTRCATSESPMM